MIRADSTISASVATGLPRRLCFERTCECRPWTIRSDSKSLIANGLCQKSHAVTHLDDGLRGSNPVTHPKILQSRIWSSSHLVIWSLNRSISMNKWPDDQMTKCMGPQQRLARALRPSRHDTIRSSRLHMRVRAVSQPGLAERERRPGSLASSLWPGV